MAIVPPLGLGSLFLEPSILLCVACLVCVVGLGVGAARRGRWRLITPALYCLISLTVILAALLLWGVPG